jgi:large subunit ribosomal protein L18
MGMGVSKQRYVARKRRHQRVRKKIIGTAERPRLNVFRSLKHIYGQIIDDTQGHTLVAVSTLDPDLREQWPGLDKTAQAKAVGQALAKRAQDKGIRKVVFDRGGYKYHGRVKALTEGSREGGLEF